ncbi:MAG: STAS domain-containing protein [Rhodocyclaceae bacterium]|nr:STAS domain-containing protein [Rhodocyclaceae bacterium]MBX3667523.1 STAS domain-containing protein [Rhodocyclaceae bacterium]
MSLPAKRYADVLVVPLAGRIDHTVCESLLAELLPHAASCRSDGDALLLDMQHLEYISSAGLRVLMLLSKEVRPRGGRVAVASLQEVVREIFDITKFSALFPIHADTPAALAALSDAAARAYAAA